MGNVTLPTPVFLSGGALCLLAGYLAGSVLGPDTPVRTTGTVVSFDAKTSQLCLEGETLAEQEGTDPDGRLCGILRSSPDDDPPSEGDEFRFVSVRTSGEVDGRSEQQVVIYGDVVG